MSTVIVFSKDRPMQLHAYLESLIRLSDCEEEQIYVLYREERPIRYDKVKSYFPHIHWIAETCFSEQLQEIVSKSEEYIMFGCDDVLFLDRFCFKDMEMYLSNHEQVLGFSLRLGRNIHPLPKGMVHEDPFFTWNWTENAGHYGYPWELDCTLYRRKDILEVFREAGIENLKTPNYLESVPEDEPLKYFKRLALAAYYHKSKAIVITVNRVQETHKNEVDSIKGSDALSLFIKYQYEDKVLDLLKIGRMNYRQIHVGSEYLQLTASPVDENQEKTAKWKVFLQNLVYLSGVKLCDLMQNNIETGSVNAKLQTMASRLTEVKVLGPEETVEYLGETGESFCRFGDGEFMLMRGEDLAFQPYHPLLALKLWEIFTQSGQNMMIGIPYQQLQTLERFNELVKQFYFTSGKWIRSFLNCYLPVQRKQYIDTGFNQVYQTYSSMNFAAYYEKVRKLFEQKKLTIIAGEGILDKLTYDVFDLAKEKEYLYGPATDAFSAYDEILKKARRIDKDRLICVILGPASKVLIRDLTQEGYTAWDIGHLAKDYDSYRKRLGRTKEEIASFYAPD